MGKRELRNDYRQIELWANTRTVPDIGSLVLFSELYADYARHCEHEGEWTHSRKAVRMVLDRVGAGRYRREGKRFVTGIAFKDDAI